MAVNICKIAEQEDNEEICAGDFVYKRSTSKNMDKLWNTFHESQDYPEFYVGKVAKMALCNCPITNKSEWFSFKQLGNIDTPKPGDEVTVYARVNNKDYQKQTVFIKVERATYYEWSMKSGNVLQLRQDFIDSITAEDKRFLRMNN
jgi:hypothetical protein